MRWKITTFSGLVALLLWPTWNFAQPRIDPFNPNAGRAPAAAANAGMISSVDIVDSPITTVFKMISDMTGWSVVMSPTLSEKPPKINIWLKNISPDQALERIGSIANLVIDRRGNVVEVMTFDEYGKVRGVEKRVLQLKFVNARDLVTTLQPLVDKDQSKVLADAETNKLILLVPQPMLDSLLKLVESLDVPFEKDAVRVIKLKSLEATDLVPKLERFLSGGRKSGDLFGASGSLRTAPSAVAPPQGLPPGAAPAPVVGGAMGDNSTKRAGENWTVQFMVEPKLNVVILRGLAADVAQTEALIQQLDLDPSIKVVGYPLRFTNARDAFQTITTLLEQEQQQRQRSGSGGDQSQQDTTVRLKVAASEQNNQIMVEGSPSDHQRMAAIISAIDRPLPAGSGGIRTYRLENSTAQEVAAVVAAIIEQRNNGSTTATQARGASRAGSDSSAPTGAGSGRTDGSAAGASVSTGAPSASGSSPTGGGANAPGGDILPPVVTAAPEINAVIIRASAADQEEFGTLIRELDKPRDQVLLEVTLVSVRSTDNFNFGLELSGARTGSSGASSNLIGFSSFGVGKVDPATGKLSFATPPPLGLNFGVFKSDDFSLVLNALKAVGDTRVTSAPRILVEDNAPGQISQLAREPYAVASQGTSSTITSFGGFAEAGTTLTVTPHVADANWLRLEYIVNLSSFDQRTAQQLAANLPPPIRQNQSQGVVRLPSESTVVLGGLASSRTDKNKSGIPLLADIPVLGTLFRTQTDSQANETLFIFIRPVVMRDPAFRDLVYLSESDIRAARVAQKDYPQNPLKLITPRQQELQGQAQQ